MAGIVRLMVYRNGVSNVIDCLLLRGERTRLRLSKRAGSSITRKFCNGRLFRHQLLGGAASNSYITGDEADALIAELQLYNQWSGQYRGRERAHHRVDATCKWLDQLDYAGTRCNPINDNEALPQRFPGRVLGAVATGTATCAAIPKRLRTPRPDGGTTFWPTQK